MTERTYLTTKELAERFNVSVSTIYAWSKQKLIPCLHFGKTRRFSIADIESFIRENSTGHEETN